ncbi:hypothetical protein DFQ27_000407 [Actinomortierella ambigua]|uniref:Carboxypeptidase n=1 Tax=Actinomortierella ambigua TaxID=1343610 RepID=A0A9P6QKA2_9FUNG|nr:hypothetical protein DFQ27_000407 [Actinomortierella ambigua]
MGLLSNKRLTAVGLLSLATSALLVSTAVYANPAPMSASGVLADADRFIDQAVQSLEFNWENVDKKVHEVLDDFSDRVKDKMGGATEWVKTLTHESFPGVQLRLKEPKLCDTYVKQYSGYLDVGSGKHFFFWFFESRNKPKSDPLTLWLNGGPGCSSLTGLFMELGPCAVKEDGSGLTHNPHSWNSNSSVIFLDQPTNVGYSYGDAVSNTFTAAEDVYALLQVFFKEFPEYQRLDFHVAGESYAGHYIPAIGAEINARNKKMATPAFRAPGVQHINLESLLIGNGLTDPKTQYEWYPEMACRNSYGPVLTDEQCDQMEAAYPQCADLIQACYDTKSVFRCLPAAAFCNKEMISPYQMSGQNPYDVREKCQGGGGLCYPILDVIQEYLNKEEVKSELGVQVQEYKSCNMQVNMRFMLNGDWMKPFHELVPPLLKDGIRVLLYSGDADFICNWMGNKAWALALPWPGQQKLQENKDRKWYANGGHAGDVRASGPLTFLRVFGAGHMVPYDKPAESLEMFNTWIQGKHFK